MYWQRRQNHSHQDSAHDRVKPCCAQLKQLKTTVYLLARLSVLGLLVGSPFAKAHSAAHETTRKTDQPERQSITIAVASNFQNTLKQLKNAYVAQLPQQTVKIRLISASSGQLYHQITRGAPFDIFFSATENYIQALKHANLTAPQSTPLHFASGRLALWAPTAKNAEEIRAWLHQPEQHNHKLVYANPQLAPFGYAAWQTLSHLKLVSAWQGRCAHATNANQAYHFIYSKAAFLGFTSLAHLKQNRIPTHQYWVVPQDHHNPIRQHGVILKGGKAFAASSQFFQYLNSEESHRIIQEAGHQLPSKLLRPG